MGNEAPNLKSSNPQEEIKAASRAALSEIQKGLPNAFSRAWKITTNPNWVELRDEPISIKQLILNYWIYLAGTFCLASFISCVVNGFPFFKSLIYLLGFKLISLLVSPVVVGLSVEKIAQWVSAKISSINASKLIVYTSSPVFLASIIFALPIPVIGMALGGLVMFVAGIYSLYLFWKALPIFATTMPSENRIPATILLLIGGGIVSAIVNIVIMGIPSAIGLNPYIIPVTIPLMLGNTFQG